MLCGVAEDAHQVVFHRQVEAARARVALPSRPAAQLIVDAPRLVPLGADDVEPADGDDLIVALVPVLLEGLLGGRVHGIRRRRA